MTGNVSNDMFNVMQDTMSQHSEDTDESWSEVGSQCPYIFRNNDAWEDEIPNEEKVRTWAATVVWPGADASRIRVDRGPGTLDFCMIGVSLVGRDGDHDSIDYALRIPRYASTDIESVVASLSFTKEKHVSIPVEDIVMLDTTRDNGLARPFILCRRRPGVLLRRSQVLLTFEQRCRLAHELGDMRRTMHAVNSTRAGYLERMPEPTAAAGLDEVAEGSGESSGGRYVVREPGHDHCPCSSGDCQRVTPAPGTTYVAGPATQSVLDLQMGFWRSQVVAGVTAEVADDRFSLFGEWPCGPPACELRAMTEELAAAGWYDGIDYVFDVNIDDRNIIVDLDAGPEQPLVTAVVDVGADFAPAFARSHPEDWLWTNPPRWMGRQDYVESVSRLTEDQRAQVKRIFDEAAGEDFVRMAYSTPYRLAASLYNYGIMGGIHNSYDWIRLDKTLKDWRDLPDAEKVRPSCF